MLLSTPLMQSKIILFLLLKGSAKLSPNCKKHCTLPGISHEDKFKNQSSLTVVKDDDLCKGKVLGCMEMTGLEKLLCKKEEGSATYKAESSRELRIEKTEVLSDVEINGLRKESKLYTIV